MALAVVVASVDRLEEKEDREACSAAAAAAAAAVPISFNSNRPVNVTRKRSIVPFPSFPWGLLNAAFSPALSRPSVK